jgi:hypothetical protein
MSVSKGREGEGERERVVLVACFLLLSLLFFLLLCIVTCGVRLCVYGFVSREEREGENNQTFTLCFLFPVIVTLASERPLCTQHNTDTPNAKSQPLLACALSATAPHCSGTADATRWWSPSTTLRWGKI